MKAWFRNLVQYGCYAVFALCVLYLTLLSMYSTSAVQLRRGVSKWAPDLVDNYNYFLPDSPWGHLAVCGILLAVLCAAVSVWGRRKRGVGLAWLCLPFFLLCVFFIFGADLYPVSDPRKILTVARQIKEHNYGQFAVEGYMHRYPDQTGIVLFYYVFHCLFGEADYLAIQVWNAALLTGAYFLLGRTARLLWGDRDKNVQDMTLLFCLAFFPMTLHVTWVYGLVPGLAFGILAFYLQLRYMDTGRLAHAAGAAVSIGFAIVWKTNSLVMLVAMCIFFVYDAIMEKGGRRRKSLLALLLTLAVNALCSWTVDAAAGRLTGIPVSEGMPKTAWVGMGLQEANYAPGTYNGFSVGLYEQNGYDYASTDAAAKGEIRARLGTFWHDKSYGVDFFGRKNAAQWNEPTFSSLSAIGGREESGRINVDSLCNGPLRYRVEGVANYLQTAVLMGVCFWLLLAFRGREGGKNGEFLLGITVVGGLLFHLFWEAKPQYVLPYFVLLLPYCAAGYSGMAGKILEIRKEWGRGAALPLQKKCRRAAAGAGIICALLGMISLLSGTRIVAYTIHVRNEPEVLRQYEEAVRQGLAEYEKGQE